MFENYLKIGFRNMLRDRQFTFLNLMGLACGLACVLLIFLWVNDELHIDKFHEKDRQLYQVMQNYPTPNGITTVDWTPGLLAQALKNEIPEIEYAASVKSELLDDGIITYDGKYFRADSRFASKDYFNIFSYPLILGTKRKALSDKYDVVISEEMALKVFHTTENAIGKTIEWKKNYYGGRFTISGVFKTIPPNSSEHFDLIFNYDFFFDKEKPGILDWRNFPVSTYVILRKGADLNLLNQKITKLIKSRNGQAEASFFLKQYSTNYLYGNYQNGKQAGGRIEYVKLFSIIAVVILSIACINFMNLSTARATKRMKEIGIKKTLGATRKKLIFQFTGESLLISFFALFIAIVLVLLLLPHFNQLTGKRLALTFNVYLIASFVGITIFTGLISSSYPALYLSGFNPIEVLKGKLTTSFGELWTRKGLVIFQFAVSVMLIVSVIVVYRQTALIQSKNLGYNRDNIIVVTKEGALNDKLESFLSEIKKLPGVLNATNSSEKLIGNDNFSTGIEWEGKVPDESMLINVFTVNYDFIETFNIGLKEGRAFSQKYVTDTSKVILNEAAIKTMRLSEPIGKTIKFWGKDMQIIGVTNNFQYQSLHKSVQPCIFRLFPTANNYGNQIWIKIKAGEDMAAIERVKKTYKEFNPGYPFEFKFIEDDYKTLYESENKVAVLSKYFAGIAIIISCLGLFGLAAFTAQKRQKEIGIRKIAGASVKDIAVMLSMEFLKLVIIAVLIAFPLAWWIMSQWLQSFAYHVNMGPGVFLIAGTSVILITVLTVSFQAIKAAVANPVKSLRTE